MIKREFDLSQLPEFVYEKLAQTLLNKTLNLRLQTYEKSDVAAGVDFLQQNEKGYADIVVVVLDRLNSRSEAIGEVVENIIRDIRLLKPFECIIIDYLEKDRTFIPYIKTNTDIKITHFGVDWIQEQLNNYPDIVKEFNIETIEGIKTEKGQKSIDELISNLTVNKNFFAVGHFWGDEDQLERFINEGIWENGHENKITNVVRSVKESDILFLKSTFVQNEVSFLRIKAIGIVTENRNDGHLLKVNWKLIDYIDLAGLGAYRNAISQIGKENVIRIIEGIFRKLPDFFEIIEKLGKRDNLKDIDLEIKSYWWINTDREYLDIEKLKEEDTQLYTSGNSDNSRIEYFYEIKKGDFGIIYQTGQNESTKAVIEILEEATSEVHDDFIFKVLYKFKTNEQQTFEDLKTLKNFSKSEVAAFNNQRSLFPLTKDEFDEVCSLSSFLEKTEGKGINRQLSKTVLNNDGAYTTEDLLDIENDVRSFALILASKEINPPMAIALFGKWGSGKSFFMEQLSRRVDELAINQGFLEIGEETNIIKEDEEEIFCKGIAQIKFNAWSYLDANLLAGLVSSIFEKLDEYITESTKSGIAKLKVQEKLSERLKALRSLIGKEENKKKRLELLKDGYKLESKKLKKNIVLNLGKEILKISKDDESLKAAYENLTLDDNKCFGENFTIDETNLVSEYKYWKNFIKNFKRVPQLFWYGVFAVLSIVLAFYLVNFKAIDLKALYSLPVVSVLMKAGWWRFIKQIKVKKYINEFNRIVETNTNIKDKVKELEDKIRFVKEQQEQAEEKIKQLEHEIQNVQTDLTENITEVAIQNFIGDRARHKDYKEYLGIVSTIRKDFETLSELFLESDDKNNEHKKEIKLERTKQEILNEDRELIEKQFTEGRKLERIILYIDDLDRCSDEKVLEVIQAVHLIMAFPLFNVVVGVDKRCVNNALIYKNLLQYSQFAGLDEIKETGIHVISPSEYLEKIFQIPFQLNDPSDENIKGMVNTFLKNQIEKEIKEETFEMADSISDVKEEVTVTQGKADDGGKEEEKRISKPDKPKEEKKKTITPRDLKLTKDELDLLEEITCIVGNIPRTIKRFINIYRIIRAHQDLDYNTDNIREEYLIIMFILALNIGKYKKHASQLMNIIKINNKALLNDVLLHKDLNNGHKDFIEIRESIEEINILKELLQFECGRFHKYVTFVGRFSFGSVEYNGNEETED